MRNITNRVATNGFCALEPGAADGRPTYDGRPRSAEVCLFSDESRVIRELHNSDQAAASIQAAWVR